ncbi:hypothetical protein E1H13_02820 [Nodosilinea sp. P-1105]|nr:hypothetical protein [Nodosilinea sp. P-1105]
MRWYQDDGSWVPTAQEQADQERQRAERLAAQLRALGVDRVNIKDRFAFWTSGLSRLKIRVSALQSPFIFREVASTHQDLSSPPTEGCPEGGVGLY